jgi:hypothetical protein
MEAGAVIFRVTWTVCGLLVAPVEEIVTVPVYWPMARVLEPTLTEMVPGVVPLAVAFSQLPEELVVTV